MGQLISVLPKTDFTFTPVGSTAVETTIARSINVVPYREGVLIARVHSKSATGGSTQTVSVVVRQAAPSADDPATDFAITSSGIATISFAIGGGTTAAMAPAFASLTAPFSPFVRIVVQASQSTTGSAMTCSLSVDMVVRE
jgi:hypothetical protein